MASPARAMTDDPIPPAATELLQRIAAGDTGAKQALADQLYDELKRLAGGAMRGQTSHTLQATGLAHEAWMRLVERDKLTFRDRQHFLASASLAMRNILIDHARRRSALKRGGNTERLPLDDVLERYEENAAGDLLAFDETLERLRAEDEELAELVQLRFFGGLTLEDIAELNGVSLSTTERRWRLARAWLRDQLSGTD